MGAMMPISWCDSDAGNAGDAADENGADAGAGDAASIDDERRR